MTERESLLAACLAEPADDNARGVYADFLREQGSPLGRFIWAGVTLSKFRGNDPVEDGMFFDAQRELHVVTRSVVASQVGTLLGWTDGEFAWDQVWNVPDRLAAVQIPDPIASTDAERRRRRRDGVTNPAAVYERGMLCGLRLPLDRWCEVAAGVLAACPLEHIEILNVPGLTLHVKGPEDGWRLEGELKLPARIGTQPATILRRVSDPVCSTREELVAAIDGFTRLVVTHFRYQADDRWPGPADLWGENGGDE